MSAEFVILKDDICALHVDAIIVPADATGEMAYGILGRMRRKGGTAIQEAAMAQAPLRIGTAIATTAGKLPSRWVIHACVRFWPRLAIDMDFVKPAILAGLALADSLQSVTVAIPGFIEKGSSEAMDRFASLTVAACTEFSPQNISKIFLTDTRPRMIRAFRENLL